MDDRVKKGALGCGALAVGGLVLFMLIGLVGLAFGLDGDDDDLIAAASTTTTTQETTTTTTEPPTTTEAVTTTTTSTTTEPPTTTEAVTTTSTTSTTEAPTTTERPSASSSIRFSFSAYGEDLRSDGTPSDEWDLTTEYGADDCSPPAGSRWLNAEPTSNIPTVGDGVWGQRGDVIDGRCEIPWLIVAYVDEIPDIVTVSAFGESWDVAKDAILAAADQGGTIPVILIDNGEVS